MDGIEHGPEMRLEVVLVRINTIGDIGQYRIKASKDVHSRLLVASRGVFQICRGFQLVSMDTSSKVSNRELTGLPFYERQNRVDKVKSLRCM